MAGTPCKCGFLVRSDSSLDEANQQLVDFLMREEVVRHVTAMYTLERVAAQDWPRVRTLMASINQVTCSPPPPPWAWPPFPPTPTNSILCFIAAQDWAHVGALVAFISRSSASPLPSSLTGPPAPTVSFSSPPNPPNPKSFPNPCHPLSPCSALAPFLILCLSLLPSPLPPPSSI